MIAIVDYGLGNLGAIRNMFARIGASAEITSDVRTLENADKLVLPGIGAFDTGMRNLAQLDLIGALSRQVVVRKVPILGICLGMHLFSRSSAEGTMAGLGWIDADTVPFSFPADATERSPHMGWNTLRFHRDNTVFGGLGSDARFYFAHSYFLRCGVPDQVIATTHYGLDFCSVVRAGNIVGMQFHPEKSHRFGLHVLRNFANAS